ncbi:hypothetical protein TNCV_422341 [Trichonephila clavipes]|nr:hypothetical protein TNCV_422341 [Trichonephila clavipes]
MECIVPVWHRSSLNIRRAANHLVSWWKGKGGETLMITSQGVLNQNCGGTEQNRAITCVVLKTTVEVLFAVMNLVGLDIAS